MTDAMITKNAVLRAIADCTAMLHNHLAIDALSRAPGAIAMVHADIKALRELLDHAEALEGQEIGRPFRQEAAKCVS